MKNKEIVRINHNTAKHWVGDGFPVSTMFSYHTQGNDISPFLLLDYAGPAEFLPSDKPRGVGIHPHRGFETVTIVYQGEVEHKDSAGNSGKIAVGDVQWMTAASGVLHEEMHSREFTKKGGTLEMVQLWVNLPAKHKMSSPRYQEILSANIPVVDLPDNAGYVRLIAGEYNDTKGAAKTFTPMELWDIRLRAGSKVSLKLTDGYTSSLLVLSGELSIGSDSLTARELAQFSRDGDIIELSASQDSSLLLMAGEPIDEPIAGYGPFVMNSTEEIQQAMVDYSTGKF
ncbi:MAG: pirin family protein [Rickettsiales bacterium]